MKRATLSRVRPFVPAAGAARLAALLVLVPSASAAGDPDELDAVWNDPVFKRQFIASYGVNSEIEPRVTPDEVDILEYILPLMASDLPRAEEELREELEEDCSAMLDFTLAGIQFQQDELEPALANYRRAVEKFPGFRRAWRNLGILGVRTGDHGAAIGAFTRMIELGGGDAYAYGLLGYAYSSVHDFQPAEVAYRNALLLQPENTEWRLGLTRCVLEQRKFEDAAALLDVLIARYPGKADFWLLQAQSFLGLDRPLEAAANLEAVERLGRGTVDSLYTLGDIYVSEELMDLAVRAYLRAMDVDAAQPLERPLRTVELLVARGAALQARSAAEHLRELWHPRMEAPELHRLLKVEARLSMAEGDGSAETAAILEEVVALDPLDGEALMLLGRHHAQANEPDRANFYYERAASLEAFEVAARVRHAQVLVGMGRCADAVPLLRRAQELAPREDVARYLEQVERLAKAQR